MAGSGGRARGPAPSSGGAMRGVIDGIEGQWARLVLDDGQRLDWPRANLPAGAAEGTAVVLDLQAAGRERVAGRVQAEGRWQGTVCAPAAGGPAAGVQARGRAMGVSLGRQVLNWPATAGLEVGDAVLVQMTPDEADTARRRRRVQGLIDDLFA